MSIFVTFAWGEKLFFVFYTDGADQYVDKADGMTYDRQWTVQPDVPQPEMARVCVQVSWRGALADRVVTVTAVALLAKLPEVALWPAVTLTPKPEVAL